MHKLTDEQRAIVASNAKSLRVIAFAGAGKTSTLEAFASARPNKSMLYLAFNKAIQQEAQSKFPPNVKCQTTHALAYAPVGREYQHKLLNGNLRPTSVASGIGLKASPQSVRYCRVVAAALNAFLHSALTEPSELTVEDLPDVPEQHINRVKADVDKLWSAMLDKKNGDVPMVHDGYLKLYQLMQPALPYDYILFDEAQDANPVTTAIVGSQRCRKVVVGDPYQQIYGFRGAKSAMKGDGFDGTLYLTESFRFGSSIAAQANRLLAVLDESREVKGVRARSPESTKAFIARGNGALFYQALDYANSARAYYYVGGIDGYRLELLLDIDRLKRNAKAEIKDDFIRGFRSYDDFQQYVEEVNDLEFYAWVKVVDHAPTRDWVAESVEKVRRCVQNRPSDDALALTTAHKSKGLEFGHVTLANDYPDFTYVDIPHPDVDPRKSLGKNWPNGWTWGPIRHPRAWDNGEFLGIVHGDAEELNIRYVAATRAQGSLSGHALKGALDVANRPLSTIGLTPYAEFNSYIGRYPRARMSCITGASEAASQTPAPTNNARTDSVESLVDLTKYCGTLAAPLEQLCELALDIRCRPSVFEELLGTSPHLGDLATSLLAAYAAALKKVGRLPLWAEDEVDGVAVELKPVALDAWDDRHGYYLSNGQMQGLAERVHELEASAKDSGRK